MAGACASLPPPPLRPEPVPYADTLPIAEPAERAYSEPAELFHAGVMDPVGAALDVGRWAGREREALNLTRMDDVVPSAWFVPRNGWDRMSPGEVARGGAPGPPPDTSRLEVVRMKEDGIQPGFWIRDARGDLYLLKLDPPGYAHLASGAEVVSSRLLHAAGYHVPSNYKVAVRPERLVIPEDSVPIEGRTQRDPPARERVEEELARAARLPDGRVVGLASRFVPGVPKGPWRFEGRRSDDPNDHYRHEHRRELRGLHVVAAWLNHIDLRFQGTMDVWIEPPGYLRHYLLDFGSTLGSGGVRPHRPREGLEHNFDLWPSLLRLVTLGFYRVGWEGTEGRPFHPAVGWLPVEDFDPRAWKLNWPNGAWRSMTPADAYWGAKIVASFDDRQLEATVAEAGLPEEAARFLLRALTVRRDRLVAHWYARVTPLERPAVEPAPESPVGGGTAARDTGSAGATGEPGGADAGFVLAFEDEGLGVLGGATRTTLYRWELRHDALGRRWRGEAAAVGAGRQRIQVGPPAGARGSPDRTGPRSGLTGEAAHAVVRIAAVRGGEEKRAATLWLRWRSEIGSYEVAALRH